MEKGSFVVRHSHRKCSAVPMDQALEKEYNKDAKEKGGVIGFFNLIKHEKLQYVRWLNELCGLTSMINTQCITSFLMPQQRKT